MKPAPASFLSRLHGIAAGRRLTPWLMSLGWTRTDASRVINGHIPGAEKLALLAEKENVNLSWLLSGLGEPRIGKAPAKVQEAAATYSVLDPLRRQLLQELAGLPDDAVKALLKTAQLMTLKK